MMTDKEHPIVSDYLSRLQAEATLRLPADRAGELLDDIRDHLRQRIAEGATEADVRNAVDKLGTPTELVDEAGGSRPGPYAGPPPPAPDNRREMVALALLVLSVVTSIVFPVAGLLLIAGLVLTLVSARWNGADKALAAVVYTILGMPLLVLGGLMAVTTSAATVCSEEGVGAGTVARQVCSSTGTSAPPWLLIPIALVFLAIHVYTAVRLYRHAGVPAHT
ncbi:MAG: hypothetical protein ABI131_03890 [Nostocoides sp.]